MSRVRFIAQTDETLRKEALETLDEIMEEIRERAAQLLEVMRDDVLTCLSDTHQQIALDLGEVELEESTAEETLNLDSFASSYPGEFKESLAELNKKPSTLWETMKLDDEWKARLEAAVLAEREECARICRDLGRGHGVAFAEFDCAEAIRARGQE